MTVNDIGSTRHVPPHEIVGTIVSGLGRGQEFVQLTGYSDQFDAKLGYEPFPGTLNLELQSDRSVIEDREPMVIEPWSDGERTFGAVDCYPATLSAGDRRSEGVHVIVPHRTDHDDSTLEIIAAVSLREALGLSDGDSVRVSSDHPGVSEPVDSA